MLENLWMTRKVTSTGMLCFVQGVAANGNGIGNNNNNNGSSTNKSSSTNNFTTTTTSTMKTTAPSMLVHRNNEKNIILSKQHSVGGETHTHHTKVKRGLLQKSR